MSEIREFIVTAMEEVMEITDSELVTELSDDSILLESGLDSLGFAILVSRLEEELGFDPFTAMEDVVYPVTFKEFVDIYKQHQR